MLFRSAVHRMCSVFCVWTRAGNVSHVVVWSSWRPGRADGLRVCVARRRLPLWVGTKVNKSERRTRLSRARRPMSITARHPTDLAIAQAARGWPCPSLLHRRRTRTPHARAISHLVQVSRHWRQARWTVRAPQLVCEAQRVCQTNTRTQYMSVSARIALKP